MTRRPAAALLLLLAGCAGPGPGPAQPEPNLEVSVHEVVESPEKEGVAYAKVFVDGEPAGMTETGAKSLEKRWQGRLPPGNHLLRIEYWVLPGLGDWVRVPDDLQPRERFVRVEEGQKTQVALKFYDLGRKNDIQVSRRRLSPAAP